MPTPNCNALLIKVTFPNTGDKGLMISFDGYWMAIYEVVEFMTSIDKG